MSEREEALGEVIRILGLERNLWQAAENREAHRNNYNAANEAAQRKYQTAAILAKVRTLLERAPTPAEPDEVCPGCGGVGFIEDGMSKIDCPNLKWHAPPDATPRASYKDIGNCTRCGHSELKHYGGQSGSNCNRDDAYGDPCDCWEFRRATPPKENKP